VAVRVLVKTLVKEPVKELELGTEFVIARADVVVAEPFAEVLALLEALALLVPDADAEPELDTEDDPRAVPVETMPLDIVTEPVVPPVEAVTNVGEEALGIWKEYE